MNDKPESPGCPTTVNNVLYDYLWAADLIDWQEQAIQELKIENMELSMMEEEAQQYALKTKKRNEELEFELASSKEHLNEVRDYIVAKRMEELNGSK